LYTITTETNLKDYPGTKFVVTVSQRVKGRVFCRLTTDDVSDLVKRRYKDFAWLKGVLNEKLDKEKEGGTIAPLPGDTVASFLGFGRFEPSFIEERRKGLQEFLNSVTNHIVTRFESRLQKFLTDPSWTPA
jgi:hypothetical protein